MQHSDDGIVTFARFYLPATILIKVTTHNDDLPATTHSRRRMGRRRTAKMTATNTHATLHKALHFTATTHKQRFTTTHSTTHLFTKVTIS
jgi:hypothetical protein